VVEVRSLFFFTSRMHSLTVAVPAASVFVSLGLRAPGPKSRRLATALLTEPAILARKLGVGELLDFDLAVVVVSAVDRDRHGAAMVGRGPGRRKAYAFEAFRHPILLGVHALPDVFAGDP